MKKILVTGVCGFLGHHFCEHIMKTTDWQITGIDRLSYASSGFERIKEIEAYNNKRVRIFTHDLTTPIVESMADEIGEQDYIVHLGAETHVYRSIKHAYPFVMTNVLGTMRLLDFAKVIRPKKFLYFSTDEVFGPADQGVAYKEWDRYDCRNPYAATKAGGEEICLAYANSYNIPMIITHCMNIFGERQHPEKFIPLVMNKIRRNEILQIHCKNGKPASRSWIHARNVSSAIVFLLENTPKVVRDKYNIPGEEYDILSLATLIARVMKMPCETRLVDYYQERPGHDPRYMLDGSKIKWMGWDAPIDFIDSMEKTIQWTLDRPKWLDWK